MKVLLVCLCFLFQAISANPASARQEATPEKPSAWSGSKVSSALVEARTDSAEQRFQDSETLMLKVTQANPKLVQPWIELGKAQMGLKKYADAENSFKTALGMKPAPEDTAPHASAAPPPDKTSDDLVEQYIRSLPVPGGSSGGLPPLAGGSPALPPPGGASNSPALPSATGAGKNLPPQILGPIYAGLGEVYAHQGKIAEAQSSFDEAVKQLPAEAADYRSNETIVFFQTGQADAQLAAAKQALALDSERPSLYYFEGQALVGKSTVDPATQKLTLPPECIEAFRKYLQVAPHGHFAAEIRGILTAGGVSPDR